MTVEPMPAEAVPYGRAAARRDWTRSDVQDAAEAAFGFQRANLALDAFDAERRRLALSHEDMDGEPCDGTPEPEPGEETLRCPDCGGIWEVGRQTLVGYGTPYDGGEA